MSFSSILGHKKVIRTLRNSIVRKRLAHAYLFTGPEGVGKRFIAFSLAKSLNCLKNSEGGDDFCDNCASCEKIESMNHPDVFFLKPDGRFIRVDQIRILKRRLQFRALEGRYKVCIIDGAGSMNLAAANALLKTLEEPPKDTIIILVKGNEGSLPATVVSRCQRIIFSPLPEEELLPWLRKRLEVDEDTLRLLIAFGGGSISRIMGINVDTITSIRKRIVDRLSQVAQGNMEEAFTWAEELSKVEDTNEHLEVLKVWLRDLILYKTLGQRDMVLNHDLFTQLERDSKRLSLPVLINLWDKVNACQKALSYNANKQLALEYTFIRRM